MSRQSPEASADCRVAATTNVAMRSKIEGGSRPRHIALAMVDARRALTSANWGPLSRTRCDDSASTSVTAIEISSAAVTTVTRRWCQTQPAVSVDGSTSMGDQLHLHPSLGRLKARRRRTEASASPHISHGPRNEDRCRIKTRAGLGELGAVSIGPPILGRSSARVAPRRTQYPRASLCESSQRWQRCGNLPTHLRRSQRRLQNCNGNLKMHQPALAAKAHRRWHAARSRKPKRLRHPRRASHQTASPATTIYHVTTTSAQRTCVRFSELTND